MSHALFGSAFGPLPAEIRCNNLKNMYAVTCPNMPPVFGPQALPGSHRPPTRPQQGPLGAQHPSQPISDPSLIRPLGTLARLAPTAPQERAHPAF